MDTGAADLLLGLIEPDEAEEIRTVAAAVLSNLLLEFSPMKAVGISYNKDSCAVEHLCVLFSY